MKQRVFML